MYEDEQLANQKMLIDETLKIMKGVVNFAGQIDSKFGTKEKKSEQKAENKTPMQETKQDLLGSNELPFEFTGQHTDLSYFLYHQSMPLKVINDIEDIELRKAVNFIIKDAEKDGYIKIEDDVITITDEGKKHISTPEFQQQIQPNIDNFRKRRKSILESKQFEWIGSDSDLLFFKDSQNLDLKQLLGNKSCVGDLRAKIAHQLSDYIEKGIINISENGIVNLTNKGKKLIDSLPVNKVTEKNVPKIIINVKNIVKTGGKTL